MTDAGPVDPNGPTGMDNRAADPNREPNGFSGLLKDRAGNFIKGPVEALSEAGGLARTELQIAPLGGAPAPGDNFQVVVDCNKEFFQNTIVKPEEISDVEKRRKFLEKISPPLSVWRRVHLEVDSMGPEPETGPQSNTVRTVVEEVTRANGVPVEVVLRAVLRDGSQDLDMDPAGRGRFENGILRVGIPPFIREFTPLLGNGERRVVFLPGFNLLTTVTDTALPILVGTVRFLDQAGTLFEFQDQRGQLTVDFVGGRVNVLGASSRIKEILPGGPLVLDPPLLIPAALRDDDRAQLPRPLEPSALEVFNDRFRDAYISGELLQELSQFDLPFDLNLEIGDMGRQINVPGALQVRAFRKPTFWAAYLQAAYQGHPLEDKDPDDEKATGGETIPAVPLGSFIYVELIREASELFRQPFGPIAITHEVGHQFGLTHLPRDVRDIMSVAPRPGDRFTSLTLAVLRNTEKSPGSE